MGELNIPPPGGDVSHREQLLSIIWIEVGVATIVLASRVICRFKIREMGWDAYTMLLNCVSLD